MADPIRIIVADDHPLFRDGVVHSLSLEEDFTVIAEAGSYGLIRRAWRVPSSTR